MQTINHIQNVEIYLDYATIPSLNYFLHFAENYQDTTTIRLFGLGRFTIPQTIIDRYPAGIIRFCQVQAGDQSQFKQLFIELLANSHTKLNLSFHLNLFHSLDMLNPLLNIAQKYRDNITGFSLNLYDDGSEGIITLNSLSEKPEYLEEIIHQHRAKIAEVKLTILDYAIFRYQWGQVYPTKYYFLDDRLLEKETLLPLKNEITSYQKMDFLKFQQFNNEQQDLILEIMNLSREKVARLVDLSHQYPIFVFLGTTIFNAPEKDMALLETLHFHLLTHYASPESPFFIGSNYFICYKGHPNSKEINQKIVDHYQNRMICLPDFIPLEILLLLGLNVSLIGGFASSSHFQFNTNHIADLVFLTTDNDEINQKNHLYKEQSELMKTMIKLNYLSAEKAHYFTRFYQ